jgi:hypothetical protein
MATTNPDGEQTTILGDNEVYQIQLMFSARDTTVVVCTCLANVYFATKRSSATAPKKTDWELFATGVPVLLLECSRQSNTRRLSLIVAERGTGFTLYRDTVDTLSAYSELGRTFHTMLQSQNHQKMTGLSFDTPYASMQFYQQVMRLTSDSRNVSLTNNQDTNKTQYKSRRRHSFGGDKRGNNLRKAEISQPCCFNHVTSLKAGDLLTAIHNEPPRHTGTSTSTLISNTSSNYSNPSLTGANYRNSNVQRSLVAGGSKQASPSQSV